MDDELSKGNECADKLANLSIKDDIEYNTPIGKLINDNTKIYINVPYSNKEYAKQNGAKWDHNKKKWYYTDDLSNEKKNKLKEHFIK